MYRFVKKHSKTRFGQKIRISKEIWTSKKLPFVISSLIPKKKNQRLIGVGVLALHEMSKTQAFLGRPVLASKWGSRFVMKRSPGLGLEPKPTVFINKNNTSDGLNYFAHTVFENMIST
jgi:hypothetical protein